MRLIGIFTLLLLLSIARVHAATPSCVDVIKKITPASETVQNASACIPESSSDPRPLCLIVTTTAKNEYMYRSVRFSPEASDLGISVVNEAVHDDVILNSVALVISNDMYSPSDIHWVKKTTFFPAAQYLYVDYYNADGLFSRLKLVENQSYNCKPVESL